MAAPKLPRFSAGIICLAWGCGAAPEPPGAVEPNGALPGTGSSGGDMALRGESPAPTPTTPPGPIDSALPDAGAAASVNDVGLPNAPAAQAPGFTFKACAASGVAGCDYIYIAAQDARAKSCIQLALDNCGSYQRPGLPIDLPLSWRLGSASIGALGEECLPQVYDPKSTPVVSAGGAISWNLESRQPSELVVDITLELSDAVDPAAGGIALATRDLVAPLPECED